jgi:hypothetical protein
MGFWQEITGTVESWFGIGKKATIAVGSDGSNLVFKDEVVVGTKTLTDLLGGGAFAFTPTVVPTGQTWTVPATEQYLVYQDLTVDGELVLDGELVVL